MISEWMLQNIKKRLFFSQKPQKFIFEVATSKLPWSPIHPIQLWLQSTPRVYPPNYKEYQNYHGLLFIKYTYGSNTTPRVDPPNYIEEGKTIEKCLDPSNNKEITYFQSKSTLLHSRGDQDKTTMASYSSNTLMVPTPLPEWILPTI